MPWVDEGLKDRKAAPDGKGPITIGAWLHYAEQRVPQLYEEIQNGPTQGPIQSGMGQGPTADPAFRNQRGLSLRLQTPQLFDFYKQAKDHAIVE